MELKKDNKNIKKKLGMNLKNWNLSKNSCQRRLNLAFLLLTIGIASTGTINAQAGEGDYMLGSDLGSGITTTGSNGLFGFNFGLNDGDGFNVGISPKAGYFINDNILVGGVLNFGYIKSPETNGQAVERTVYGAQGLFRYYVRPGQYEGMEDLPSRGLFFFESNAGIAGNNISGGASTNGFAFGVGPGYSFFVTNNVALELSAKYNGLVGGGNTSYQHSLGLNIGIQMFFDPDEAGEAIDE